MPSILVVEDDVDLAKAISELLASMGHAVRTASNGVEGLQRVAEELPDLIVLDVEMPILDGPGMVKALASQRAGQGPIPILLVSGVFTLERIARSIRTPYYLKKPFSISGVVALVKEALRSD